MKKGYVRARSTHAAGTRPQGCLPFPLSPHIKVTHQLEQVLGRQPARLYTLFEPIYTPFKVDIARYVS
jgi:hypothetical protein